VNVRMEGSWIIWKPGTAEPPHGPIPRLDGGPSRRPYSVPLLEFEDGRRLSESDAILWYLSEGTFLLPADR